MSMRLFRLWWAAVLAVIAALVVELVIWFVPELLRASREPALSTQFCLVLEIRTDIACITVTFLTLVLSCWTCPEHTTTSSIVSEVLCNMSFTLGPFTGCIPTQSWWYRSAVPMARPAT